VVEKADLGKQLKVQHYINDLDDATALDQVCVCTKAGGNQAAKLPLCDHEFHPPCLKKVWLTCPVFTTLTCPKCGIDYTEQIKGVMVADGELKHAQRDFDRNQEPGNLQSPKKKAIARPKVPKPTIEEEPTGCATDDQFY